MIARFTHPTPLIFGIQGAQLTDEEKVFFQCVNPLGFILFRWNLENPQQIQTLIQTLHEVVDRQDLVILVDAEGGRVFRLPPEHFPLPPAPRVFGDLYIHNPQEALQKCFENFYTIGRTLKTLGFTASCSPLLDLDTLGTHGVIGDRSFGADPEGVGHLGRATAAGLKAAGIVSVMKHIPGHGGAPADSHEELPVIGLTRQELAAHWIPFQMNAQGPWAMTAHVLYPALDPHTPGTFSPTVIQEIIRGVIGFQGVLISDDLYMKALSGRPADKIRRSLEAGCDVALYGLGGVEVFQKAVFELEPFLRAYRPHQDLKGRTLGE